MTKQIKTVEKGQEPIHSFTILWLIILVFLWGGNAAAVKVVIREIPPFWAAFFRFVFTLPFIFWLIRRAGKNLRITWQEFKRIFILAMIMVAQIFCLHYGSYHTTGGRVALFTFSFPVFVPIIAPMIIANEVFRKNRLVGTLIACIGLIIAMQTAMGSSVGETSMIKGDMVELASSFLLALMMVYNKYLALSINKWKILFWEFLIAIVFFLGFGLIFENFSMANVGTEVVAGLLYQILIIGIFCWTSLQYLLAKHNASSVTVFFFLTPIFGMLISAVLLNESLDISLLIGGVFVATGIFIVEKC